jgi:uncharacterized protein YjiS (DUF1127 family)
MSCGSKTCAITTSGNPRYLETAERPARLAGILRKLGAMVESERRRQFWLELEKARQRGLLKDLDDRMLRDIGLTREQATREARKWFWQ